MSAFVRGRPLGLAIAVTLSLGAAVVIFGSAEPEPEPAETRAPIDVASLGPQVGERVPDFRLPDQSGEMRSLESVLGPNGAMLLFHRSADW